ncbi:hypothetical protein N8314_00840 [Akkermansiaceae bacterium]|nr:hypothetical protein [Akkermansiaceae bacterium]
MTDEHWAKAKQEEELMGSPSRTNYMLKAKEKYGVVDLMSEQQDHLNNTVDELDNIDLDDLSTEDIL